MLWGWWSGGGRSVFPQALFILKASLRSLPQSHQQCWQGPLGRPPHPPHPPWLQNSGLQLNMEKMWGELSGPSF